MNKRRRSRKGAFREEGTNDSNQKGGVRVNINRKESCGKR